MKEFVWNKIWENDSYSNEQLRKSKTALKINEIIKYLELNKETKILDVGCGAGYISNELFERFNCEIVGIDASIISIEKAKERNKNIEFNVMDATEIEFPKNYFDVVLCIGILEHIEEIDKCIVGIKKVIKSKGKLVVISSNKLSFMYAHRRIKQFLGIWKYGYQKNWYPNKLKSYFERSGFKVLNMNYLVSKGDFGYINFFDRLLSLFVKQWSRYFILILEDTKHD